MKKIIKVYSICSTFNLKIFFSRTERLEKRAKRKTEDDSSHSSGSSKSKGRQSFVCKKKDCPDNGVAFKTKAHLK